MTHIGHGYITYYYIQKPRCYKDALIQVNISYPFLYPWGISYLQQCQKRRVCTQDGDSGAVNVDSGAAYLEYVE